MHLRLGAQPQEQTHTRLQRGERVLAGALPHGRRDLRDDRLFHVVVDGDEQPFLVVELVVERTARHAGLGDDLLGADVGEAAFAEQLPAGADQRRAGRRGPLGLGTTVDFHTGCT